MLAEEDPGKHKVFCRHGTKRVENIIDSNKSSTSVMMATTATRQLSPQYLVYRSVYLLLCTMYNRTKSG